MCLILRHTAILSAVYRYKHCIILRCGEQCHAYNLPSLLAEVIIKSVLKQMLGCILVGRMN